MNRYALMCALYFLATLLIIALSIGSTLFQVLILFPVFASIFKGFLK